jgi:NADH-quinone oxidoreductase subunit J
MNIIALIIISAVVLAGALAAAFLPRLVHAALAVVLTFLGVACMYLLLGAEFVGLVQIFVYVGAVAILIVFTILLTNPEEKSRGVNLAGVLAGVAVFVGLAWAILSTALPTAVPEVEPLTVKQIGDTLMADYVWPLMSVGLLLTAALLGALILVMEEKE